MAVNQTAAELPPGQSEAEASGLQTVPSSHVRPPRVLGCPVAMECRLDQVVRLGHGQAQALVVAEVLAFHIDEAVWDAKAGQIDASKLDPLSRLGGQWFGTLGEGIELPRPDWQASGFVARVAARSAEGG
ncbi:MAG: flavin reductase [Deltaproteobacteria bacterium]|nr:flavin reductase [Deltaproteobacteria bacterium]